MDASNAMARRAMGSLLPVRSWMTSDTPRQDVSKRSAIPKPISRPIDAQQRQPSTSSSNLALGERSSAIPNQMVQPAATAALDSPPRPVDEIQPQGTHAYPSQGSYALPSHSSSASVIARSPAEAISAPLSMDATTTIHAASPLQERPMACMRPSGPTPSDSSPGAWRRPQSIPPYYQDFNALQTFLVQQQVPMGPQDRSIIHHLTQAMQWQDSCFLTMCNLIFSPEVFGIDPSRLPCRISEPAMRAIGVVFGPIMSINQHIKIFCAHFPMPLVEFLSNLPQKARELISVVDNMFSQLYLHWAHLCQECSETKLLPVPHDLSESCGIRSPVVQQAVFARLLRVAWGDILPPVITSAVLARFFQCQKSIPTDTNPLLAADDALGTYRYFSTAYYDHSPYSPGASEQTWARTRNALRFTRYLTSARSGPETAAAPASYIPNVSHQTQLSYPPPGMHYYNEFQQSTRTVQSPTTNFTPQLPSPQLTMRSDSRGSPLEPDARTRTTISPTTSMKAAAVVSETVLQYVAYMKLAPVKLFKDPAVQEYSFNISSEEYLARPQETTRPDGSKTTHMASETRSFRLRCCSISHQDHTETLAESVWVMKETKWPDYVYFTLNEQQIPIQTADATGKFSAVPVTQMLILGKNTLKIYINRLSTDNAFLDSGFALEVVRFASIPNAMKDCISHRTIPADDVVTDMKRTLNAQSTTSDEDDVLFVSKSLTISLLEPFSGTKMFDIPARGKTCNHRQAFDLKTFLETRPKHPKKHITKPDAWKCPICARDARPASLVIDGFLIDVRKELSRRNMLDAKAIVVDKDGSWKPQEDPNRQRSISAGVQKAMEVVELSDDDD